MNQTIALPVRVEEAEDLRPAFGRWLVRTADGYRIASQLTLQDANQIATALNHHDKLVELLEQLSDAVFVEVIQVIKKDSKALLTTIREQKAK